MAKTRNVSRSLVLGLLAIMLAGSFLLVYVPSVQDAHAISGLSIDGTTTILGCTSPCTTDVTTSDSNDVIVVMLAFNAGVTVSSVVDSGSAGLSFNTRFACAGADRSMCEYYAIAPSALNNEPIKITGSGNINGFIFGVNGADTASPYDANVGLPNEATQNSASSAFCTVSTSNANDMIITDVADGGTSAIANPAAFSTIIPKAGSAPSFAGAYQVVSSTQSGTTVTWSLTSTATGSEAMCDAIQSSVSVPISLGIQNGASADSATVTCAGGGGSYTASAGVQNFICNPSTSVVIALSSGGAHNQWCFSGQCTSSETFTSCSSGTCSTQSYNYYEEFQNTWQASTNGNGPPTWDSGLSMVPTGEQGGTMGQNVCTISPTSGSSTAATCSGWSDYNTAVTSPSTASGAGANIRWMLSGTSSFSPTTGGNIETAFTYYKQLQNTYQGSPHSPSTWDVGSLALDGGGTNVCGTGTCGTSLSATLTTSDTNDVIVLFCAGSSGTINAPTDTAGLTWTQRGSELSAGSRISSLYSAVSTAKLSSDSITCGFAAAQSDDAISAWGVNGANLISPFDPGSSLPNNNGFNPETNPSCTMTTSNANDLLISAVLSAGTWSANPSGFSTISQSYGGAGFGGVYAAYDTVSSTQSSVAETFATGLGRGNIWCDAIQAAPAVSVTGTSLGAGGLNICSMGAPSYGALTAISCSGWADYNTVTSMGTLTVSANERWSPATPTYTDTTGGNTHTDNYYEQLQNTYQVTSNYVQTLALDGTGNNQCTTSTSCTATLSTSHSNDVVVASCYGAGSGLTFSISDTGGLTWHQRSTTYSPSNNRQIAVFYAAAPSTLSSDGIKCTSSVNSNLVAILWGISGANTISPFDSTGGLPGTNSGNSASPSCTVSTSNAKDFVLAIAQTVGAVTWTASPGGFSLIAQNTAAGPSSIADYEVVSSIQSSVTESWTISGSGNWAAWCDAIVAASTFDSGLAFAMTGTSLGSSGQTVCSVSPASTASVAPCSGYADYGTTVSFPTNPTGQASNTRWEVSGTSTFTDTTGGNTHSVNYYKQLQNTYEASPNAQPSWDNGLTAQSVVGSLLGASGQTVCSIALPNGGGAQSCTGYADYSTSAVIGSATIGGAPANSQWERSGACAFTQATGGNTNNCNFYKQLNNTYEVTPNAQSTWDGGLTAQSVVGTLLGSAGQAVCSITLPGGGGAQSCAAFLDYDTAVVIGSATIAGAPANSQWLRSGSCSFTQVTGGQTDNCNYYKQWDNTFQVTAKSQTAFDGGLSLAVSGTLLGVSSSTICTIFPAFGGAMAICSGYTDSNTVATLPASLTGASSNTRWENAGNGATNTASIASGGNTFNTNYYKQVFSTYQDSPIAPSTWDPGLTFTVTGTYLGTSSSTLCTVSPAGGSGSTSCSGWTDYGQSFAVSDPSGAASNTRWQVFAAHTIYVPITLTNNQASATPTIFQQEITFNPSTYAVDERSDLGNIRFCSDLACTQPLYAWLESCVYSCGTSATSATVWVRLTSPIAGSGGTATIYMVFLPSSTDFDGTYWGEAPYLSSTYGQHDNGADVFAFYDNFAGTSLSSNWTPSLATGSTLTVNNGLSLTHPTSGVSSVYTGSTFGAGVLDFYASDGLTAPSGSGSSCASYIGLDKASSGSSYDDAAMIGSCSFFGDTVGLITDNNAGAYTFTSGGSGYTATGIYSIEIPSSSPSSVTAQVNYGGSITSATTLPTLPQPIVFSTMQNGVNIAGINWIRFRAYLPSGVMPSVSLGSATGGYSSAPPTSTGYAFNISYYKQLQNSYGIAANAQTVFDPGLAFNLSGTYLGSGSSAVCSMTPASNSTDTCLAWSDYGTAVAYPVNPTGAPANARWQATGTTAFTDTTGGNSHLVNYYKQLSNTYTATPASPNTWDSVLTITAAGTIFGTGSSTVCTVTTSAGGGSVSCSGYSDYDTAVSFPSPIPDGVHNQWTGAAPLSFTDLTGGNAHAVSYTLQSSGLNFTAEPVAPSSWDGTFSVTVTGTYLGVSTTVCTITTVSEAGSASCSGTIDAGTSVTFANAVADGANARWETSQSVQTPSGTTTTAGYYLQLQDTFQATPNAQVTWDAGLTGPAVKGTVLGVGSTSVCALILSGGGGAASCSGWADSGLPISFGTIVGVPANSRWEARGTTTFTDTGAGGNAFNVNYYKQYTLLVAGGNGIGYSVASQTGDNYWDSGTVLTVSSNGVYGRVAGTGQRVSSWSIDGSPGTRVATTGAVATGTITMSAAHTVSFSSVVQYQVVLDSTSVAALSSCTAPSISGDGYWYDSGTSLVACSLHGVWGRSGGAGDRLTGYSVDGGPPTVVSTTGLVTPLSVTNIASPQSIAATGAVQYMLTIAASPSAAGVVAYVTPPAIGGDTGWYDSGITVTFYVTPNSGYIFDRWLGSGACSYTGSATTPSVVMSCAASESASFAGEVRESITLQSTSSSGLIPYFEITGCNPAPDIIPGDGSVVSVELSPSCSFTVSIINTGNTRYGFSVSGAFSNNSPSQLSCASGTCAALTLDYFEQVSEQFAYSIADGSSGFTTPTLTCVQAGTTGPCGQLAASPFSFWLDYGSSWSATNPLGGSNGTVRWVSSATTGLASEPSINTVVYSHQFLVAFQTDPETGGLMSPTAATSQWVDSGSSLSLSETPSSGFSFASWASSSSTHVAFLDATAGSTTASIDGSAVITARFNLALVAVTFTESGLPAGTTWSATVGGDNVTAGTAALTFELPPATYSWTVGTPIAGQTSGVRFVASTSGGTIIVSGPESQAISFLTQYYLMVGVGSSASGITLAPASGWYDAGSQLFLNASASPSTYLTFLSWTGAGAGSYSGPEAVARISMSGPVTETADFGREMGSVTFVESGLPNGTDWSVVVNGVNQTSQGDSITFGGIPVGSTVDWVVESPTSAPGTGSLLVLSPQIITVTITFTTSPSTITTTSTLITGTSSTTTVTVTSGTTTVITTTPAGQRNNGLPVIVYPLLALVAVLAALLSIISIRRSGKT